MIWSAYISSLEHHLLPLEQHLLLEAGPLLHDPREPLNLEHLLLLDVDLRLGIPLLVVPPHTDVLLDVVELFLVVCHLGLEFEVVAEGQFYELLTEHHEFVQGHEDEVQVQTGGDDVLEVEGD